MRIVEFGPVAIFARTHPEATEWIFAGTGRGHLLGAQVEDFGLRQFARLLRLVRMPGPAFVACHVPDRSLRGHPLIAAAYHAIIRGSMLPIVGLDFADRVALTSPALHMLAACTVYFKRELPFDRSELLPNGSEKERRLLERNLGKIRPISLGLGEWRIDGLPHCPQPKTADVFFAGRINSAARRNGVPLLQRAAAEGLRVDFPNEALDRPAFLRRLSQSHLAWAPEGLGWQTFRQFEAAVAGSVPVVNRGRIEVPHALRDAEHCFYYEDDGEDMIRVLRQAVVDQPRLSRVAAAARDHVLAHHTHRAVTDQILAEAGRFL